ncbi:MAG: hypothetical protein NW241_18550 [Bacteroidia bacterium]|nr:hypothetical protein [Bacteroidia bacterium]
MNPAYHSLLQIAFRIPVREVVLRKPADAPAEERDALLVLPGLSDAPVNRRFQTACFSRFPYDLFIPVCVQRQGMAQSLEHLDQFIRVQELERYRRLYVFGYILGGYLFTELLRRRRLSNLAGVVFDRGPIQERAPEALMRQIPRIAPLISGRVLRDFAAVRYRGLDTGAPAGLLVEHKATRLMTVFRKAALRPGPPDFDPASFGQPFQDYCYVPLDHDQMYYRLEVFSGELLHFFQHGHFSAQAPRTPFAADPFKYPPQ